MSDLSNLPPERLSGLLRHVDALLEAAIPHGLQRELNTFRADILGYTAPALVRAAERHYREKVHPIWVY